jgi:non-reducing end alpha-L-arabinofuranosidase
MGKAADVINVSGKFSSYGKRLVHQAKRMGSNVVVLIVLVSVMVLAVSCTSVSPKQPVTGSLPCDIYMAAGTPCVAAHSTVRALFSSYNGKLYQVRRWSDSTIADIATLGAGGYANAAAQDAFCAGTSCTITTIYDQTQNGNNLAIEGPGGNGGKDHGANAFALPLIVNGHKVYGLYVSAGVGYRDNATSHVARNGAAEGAYMVTSGTHVNHRCCFDYGNAETTSDDDGNGRMDAINISTTCKLTSCSGPGPWIRGDLENGLFGGGASNPKNRGNASTFVSAFLKNNGQNKYTIKGGNAQAGNLSTWYSGLEPKGGYSPMHQEGGVVLGTGGDDSNGSVGSFFEGVMTSGYPTDAADNAVQANIVSAGYNSDNSSFSLTGPSYQMTNVNSGKVLAAMNCGSANSTTLDVQKASGTTCQQWKFARSSSGTYTITNGDSGEVLSALNCDGQQDSTIANLQPPTGSICQQWDVVAAGNNRYEIVIANNGTVLSGTNCATAGNSGVDLRRWIDTTCQVWNIAG